MKAYLKKGIIAKLKINDNQWTFYNGAEGLLFEETPEYFSVRLNGKSWIANKEDFNIK